jgi:hypothetical protein
MKVSNSDAASRPHVRSHRRNRGREVGTAGCRLVGERPKDVDRERVSTIWLAAHQLMSIDSYSAALWSTTLDVKHLASVQTETWISGIWILHLYLLITVNPDHVLHWSTGKMTTLTTIITFYDVFGCLQPPSHQQACWMQTGLYVTSSSGHNRIDIGYLYQVYFLF